MGQSDVQHQEQNEKTVFASDFIAGLIGGSAGLVVGHPFDTIKVQQQIASRHHVPSMSKCCKLILKEQGPKGYFMGLGFPLAAVGALNMIFFGVYGNTVRFLGNNRKKPAEKIAMVDVFVAGGIAGAIQGIPATPIELIKCKLQAQRQELLSARKQGRQVIALYKGPLDCLKHIYSTGGIHGCFRGLNATITREVPGFSVYITSYEWMNLNIFSDGKSDMTMTSMLISGGLAGVVSWIISTPVDVIKSRLQTDSIGKYRGFLHCFLKSYQQEGLSVFFRGLPVSCIRAFPVNAVTLTVYTLTLKFLQENGFQTEAMPQVIASNLGEN